MAFLSGDRMRININTNEPLEELDEPITLTVYTRVPEKYTLIDNETGQVYLGDKSGRWKKKGIELNEKES